MNPLAIEIWMSILVAYTLVSLTLWLIARFSPFEWIDVHPCLSKSNQNGRTPSSCKHQTPVVMKQNDFTMGNAFWFTIGSLMQQGSDLNPQVSWFHLQSRKLHGFCQHICCLLEGSEALAALIRLNHDIRSWGFCIFLLDGCMYWYCTVLCLTST
jgi:hypothetical protein